MMMTSINSQLDWLCALRMYLFIYVARTRTRNL